MSGRESSDSGPLAAGAAAGAGLEQPLNITVKPAVQFLGDPSDTYKMRANPRGWVLLINNENFNSAKTAKYERRRGSAVDEKNLTALFTQLGFRVLPYRDQSKQQMKKAILDFADLPDHAGADMSIVCICSHGLDRNKILGSDCEELDLWEDILSPFNNEECPSLQGKPKMFLLQACRGSKNDFGIVPETGATRSGGQSATGLKTIEDQYKYKKRPCWEDMLIVYSTIPGYIAMRDHYTGAWFVRCLCEEFSERAHDTPLRRMLDGAALRLSRVEGYDRGNMESCTYESVMFFKQLFFNPGMAE